MKEGWEEKRIGDIAEIKGGKRLPKGVKLLTTPTRHPYIRVADFNDFGTVDTNDIHYIPDVVYEQIKRYIIKKEDVYISIAGTIGKSGVIPDYLDGANLTENACRLVLSNNLNQRYVYYFTISPSFIKQIDERTKKSAQPKLALTRLADVIISYPNIKEQQSIVDYLDSAFAKIDAMKANAEKALNEAKALFQASLKEMLEPKEGWEEKVFGDLVVSNIVGLTRGKIEQGYDKKYPYFKMNNISPNNTLCWDDLICVDANKEELEKYCLQEGDFLFNTRNSKEWVGKSTVYRDYDAPVMLYNNNVMRIRFVDTINPVFIAYSFLADYTKDQLEKIKSGTTNVWAIYYRDLSKILLTYPSISEQQSIVSTLDSLKSKVDRLQANYDKISQECDALKQAILRQVFE